MAAIAAAIALGAGGVLVATPAAADVPPVEITDPFVAPSCEGSTVEDPDNAVLGDPPFPDLRNVFGQRLADYNAGRVVMLYDSYGSNFNNYPPLCGTRYIEGVGPVSEWMYCTDLDADPCGMTTEDGELTNVDGIVLPPLQDVGINPKLTADQEKIIAYLVRHGHTFVGDTPYFTAPGAASHASTAQRDALQYLVWCISDPGATDPRFIALCADNMDASVQQHILSLIPETPTLILDFPDSSGVVDIGEIAEFTLTTNLYNQPISLTTTGGTVDVCGGSAVLSGTELTVAGTDPDVLTSVTFCATSDVVATVSVTAESTPPSTEHISWNQSVSLDVVCQVFATFESTQATPLSDTSTARFVEPTGLAATGPSSAASSLAPAGVLLVAMGALALLVRRRTTHS